MAARILTVQPDQPLEDAVRAAADVLSRGGIVAFPTETVYGLAVRADDVAAVERLRSVKQRDEQKAFTVHIGSGDRLEHFVPQPSRLARRFVRKGWPGPLTLVLPVEDPDGAPVMSRCNGRVRSAIYYENSVGLRFPDDRVARALLSSVEAPIIAASANQAERAPAETAEEVIHGVGDQIDLVLDAGRTRYSKASTVVRVRGETYEVLREGVLDARIVQQLATVRLLFVCTGNTCRSPMAAALAKQWTAREFGCPINELEKWGIIVQSAGTAGGTGGAAPQAVQTMAKRGLDISRHRSTALVPELLHQADYIFTMTQANHEHVLNMRTGIGDRVKTLLVDQDVADPFGGSLDEYESCAATIEEGLQARFREVSL